jgi:hypothetical protein
LESKTFEGEGMTFLPDVQNNQTPLRHVAEDLNPRYRSDSLSSRILLLFIALGYCTSLTTALGGTSSANPRTIFTLQHAALAVMTRLQ